MGDRPDDLIGQPQGELQRYPLARLPSNPLALLQDDPLAFNGSRPGGHNRLMAPTPTSLPAYRPRVVDARLEASLGAIGAVLIEGSKAFGKTETARRAARSEVRMDTPAARQAYAVDPALILGGETPRLIDKWQEEPTLWNDVRRAVDDRRATGQFILAGSSVPRDDARRHSGAGRFIHVRMRPMTLAEVGLSSGRVSLAAVLAGEGVAAPDPGLSVGDLAERIVTGGWPGNLGLTPGQAMRANAAISTTPAGLTCHTWTGPAAIPPACGRCWARSPGTSRAR